MSTWYLLNILILVLSRISDRLQMPIKWKNFKTKFPEVFSNSSFVENLLSCPAIKSFLSFNILKENANGTNFYRQ